MKASDKLSQHGTNMGIGTYGGRGPRDLSNPSSNRIQPLPDADHDGIKDENVSEELSEASAHLGNAGKPYRTPFNP